MCSPEFKGKFLRWLLYKRRTGTSPYFCFCVYYNITFIAAFPSRGHLPLCKIPVIYISKGTYWKRKTHTAEAARQDSRSNVWWMSLTDLSMWAALKTTSNSEWSSSAAVSAISAASPRRDCSSRN